MASITTVMVILVPRISKTSISAATPEAFPPVPAVEAVIPVILIRFVTMMAIGVPVSVTVIVVTVMVMFSITVMLTITHFRSVLPVLVFLEWIVVSITVVTTSITTGFIIKFLDFFRSPAV